MRDCERKLHLLGLRRNAGDDYFAELRDVLAQIEVRGLSAGGECDDFDLRLKSNRAHSKIDIRACQSRLRNRDCVAARLTRRYGDVQVVDVQVRADERLALLGHHAA